MGENWLRALRAVIDNVSENKQTRKEDRISYAL